MLKLVVERSIFSLEMLIVKWWFGFCGGFWVYWEVWLDGVLVSVDIELVEGDFIFV